MGMRDYFQGKADTVEQLTGADCEGGLLARLSRVYRADIELLSKELLQLQGELEAARALEVSKERLADSNRLNFLQAHGDTFQCQWAGTPDVYVYNNTNGGFEDVRAAIDRAIAERGWVPSKGRAE